MGRRTAAVAILTGMVATGVGAQTPPDSGVPTVSISLEAWALPSATEIRDGELSLALTDQPQLSAIRLWTGEPPGRRASPEAGGASAADGGPTGPGSSGTRRGAANLVDGAVMVGRLAEEEPNLLGGYARTFQRAPSWIRTESEEVDGRQSLELQWRQAGEGFAGLAIQLYDASIPEARRSYLDARDLSVLGFWVRGAEGGEELELKLADATWDRRGDAVTLGPLSGFLPSGRVERRWQRAVVPLHSLPRGLDRGALANLVLLGVTEGPGSVFLAGVSLATEPSKLISLPEIRSERVSKAAPEQAIWVWGTERFLRSPSRWRGALTALTELGVKRAYLQIPVDSAGGPAPGRLAPLVRDLSSRDILAYALDGSAELALPRNHPRVLRTVEAVAAHNVQAPPGERFYGVRHDIEPYLLPGFGGGRRDELLRGYLQVVEASARRARGGGLVYAVDIPFWYDGISMEYRGREAPVSDHVLEMVDEIAIMDYRTSAGGEDGAVAQALQELSQAARTGVAVYVGLETEALPDTESLRFSGRPVSGGATPPGRGAWVGARVEEDVLRLALVEEGRRWPGDGEVLWWRVENRVPVPASSLTFAELGMPRLRQVLAEIHAELADAPAFAGVALHHLDGVMRLRRRSGG